MALRDLLFESGDVATATPATSATHETGRTGTVAKVATVAVATPRNSKTDFIGDKAVAKARDLNTGDLVPYRLAMVAPVPGNELQARLGSFRSRKIPKEIHLVDILCPATSGGLKGLTFRVDQLPGLIRALLSVQTQALERGWLAPPIATAQQE